MSHTKFPSTAQVIPNLKRFNRRIRPRDANALAALMKRVWYNADSVFDTNLKVQARRAYPAHQCACAQEFMSVVNEIVTW